VTESSRNNQEVDQFILEEIDSVPHLEALLLLWNSRPAVWTTEELAKRLYVDTGVGRVLVEDLARKRLIAPVPGVPEQYRYQSLSEEKDLLIGRLDLIYRREVVRISNMIHSKPSSAVRDFARAFRFTKERD